MLREYQLANFKSIAGPEQIHVRPITLIFGPNSSGKSSVIQSLLLLKQTLEETERPNLSLLPKGDYAELGSYSSFIHQHDVERAFSFKMSFSTDPALIDEA